MKPVRTDPITGLYNFLASGMQCPDEKDTINTVLEGIIVDTCPPKDTHIWETGIERKTVEGKWVIVEQYPDRAEAEVGHQKWVELMTEHPDYPLKDIDAWGLGRFFGEED